MCALVAADGARGASVQPAAPGHPAWRRALYRDVHRTRRSNAGRAPSPAPHAEHCSRLGATIEDLGVHLMIRRRLGRALDGFGAGARFHGFGVVVQAAARLLAPRVGIATPRQYPRARQRVVKSQLPVLCHRRRSAILAQDGCLFDFRWAKLRISHVLRGVQRAACLRPALLRGVRCKAWSASACDRRASSVSCRPDANWPRGDLAAGVGRSHRIADDDAKSLDAAATAAAEDAGGGTGQCPRRRPARSP